jgi:hypothetical protein
MPGKYSKGLKRLSEAELAQKLKSLPSDGARKQFMYDYAQMLSDSGAESRLDELNAAISHYIKPEDYDTADEDEAPPKLFAPRDTAANFKRKIDETNARTAQEKARDEEKIKKSSSGFFGGFFSGAPPMPKEGQSTWMGPDAKELNQKKINPLQRVQVPAQKGIRPPSVPKASGNRRPPIPPAKPEEFQTHFTGFNAKEVNPSLKRPIDRLVGKLSKAEHEKRLDNSGHRVRGDNGPNYTTTRDGEKIYFEDSFNRKYKQTHFGKKQYDFSNLEKHHPDNADKGLNVNLVEDTGEGKPIKNKPLKPSFTNKEQYYKAKQAAENRSNSSHFHRIDPLSGQPAMPRISFGTLDNENYDILPRLRIGATDEEISETIKRHPSEQVLAANDYQAARQAKIFKMLDDEDRAAGRPVMDRRKPREIRERFQPQPYLDENGNKRSASVPPPQMPPQFGAQSGPIPPPFGPFGPSQPPQMPFFNPFQQQGPSRDIGSIGPRPEPPRNAQGQFMPQSGPHQKGPAEPYNPHAVGPRQGPMFPPPFQGPVPGPFQPPTQKGPADPDPLSRAHEHGPAGGLPISRAHEQEPAGGLPNRELVSQKKADEFAKTLETFNAPAGGETPEQTKERRARRTEFLRKTNEEQSALRVKRNAMIEEMKKSDPEGYKAFQDQEDYLKKYEDNAEGISLPVFPKKSAVKAPEFKPPEVKAPEVKAPEVKAPEAKAPAPIAPAPTGDFNKTKYERQKEKIEEMRKKDPEGYNAFYAQSYKDRNYHVDEEGISVPIFPKNAPVETFHERADRMLREAEAERTKRLEQKTEKYNEAHAAHNVPRITPAEAQAKLPTVGPKTERITSAIELPDKQKEQHLFRQTLNKPAAPKIELPPEPKPPKVKDPYKQFWKKQTDKSRLHIERPSIGGKDLEEKRLETAMAKVASHAPLSKEEEPQPSHTRDPYEEMFKNDYIKSGFRTYGAQIRGGVPADTTRAHERARVDRIRIQKEENERNARIAEENRQKQIKTQHERDVEEREQLRQRGEELRKEREDTGYDKFFDKDLQGQEPRPGTPGSVQREALAKQREKEAADEQYDEFFKKDLKGKKPIRGVGRKERERIQEAKEKRAARLQEKAARQTMRDERDAPSDKLFNRISKDAEKREGTPSSVETERQRVSAQSDPMFGIDEHPRGSTPASETDRHNTLFKTLGSDTAEKRGQISKLARHRQQLEQTLHPERHYLGEPKPRARDDGKYELPRTKFESLSLAREDRPVDKILGEGRVLKGENIAPMEAERLSRGYASSYGFRRYNTNDKAHRDALDQHGRDVRDINYPNLKEKQSENTKKWSEAKLAEVEQKKKDFPPRLEMPKAFNQKKPNIIEGKPAPIPPAPPTPEEDFFNKYGENPEIIKGTKAHPDPYKKLFTKTGKDIQGSIADRELYRKNAETRKYMQDKLDTYKSHQYEPRVLEENPDYKPSKFDDEVVLTARQQRRREQAALEASYMTGEYKPQRLSQKQAYEDWLKDNPRQAAVIRRKQADIAQAKALKNRPINAKYTPRTPVHSDEEPHKYKSTLKAYKATSDPERYRKDVAREIENRDLAYGKGWDSKHGRPATYDVGPEEQHDIDRTRQGVPEGYALNFAQKKKLLERNLGRTNVLTTPHEMDYTNVLESPPPEREGIVQNELDGRSLNDISWSNRKQYEVDAREAQYPPRKPKEPPKPPAPPPPDPYAPYVEPEYNPPQPTYVKKHAGAKYMTWDQMNNRQKEWVVSNYIKRGRRANLELIKGGKRLKYSSHLETRDDQEMTPESKAAQKEYRDQYNAQIDKLARRRQKGIDKFEKAQLEKPVNPRMTQSLPDPKRELVEGSDNPRKRPMVKTTDDVGERVHAGKPFLDWNELNDKQKSILNKRYRTRPEILESMKSEKKGVPMDFELHRVDDRKKPTLFKQTKGEEEPYRTGLPIKDDYGDKRLTYKQMNDEQRKYAAKTLSHKKFEKLVKNNEGIKVGKEYEDMYTPAAPKYDPNFKWTPEHELTNKNWLEDEKVANREAEEKAREKVNNRPVLFKAGDESVEQENVIRKPRLHATDPEEEKKLRAAREDFYNVHPDNPFKVSIGSHHGPQEEKDFHEFADRNSRRFTTGGAPLASSQSYTGDVLMDREGIDESEHRGLPAWKTMDPEWREYHRQRVQDSESAVQKMHSTPEGENTPEELYYETGVMGRNMHAEDPHQNRIGADLQESSRHEITPFTLGRHGEVQEEDERGRGVQDPDPETGMYVKTRPNEEGVIRRVGKAKDDSGMDYNPQQFILNNPNIQYGSSLQALQQEAELPREQRGIPLSWMQRQALNLAKKLSGWGWGQNKAEDMATRFLRAQQQRNQPAPSPAALEQMKQIQDFSSNEPMRLKGPNEESSVPSFEELQRQWDEEDAQKPPPAPTNPEDILDWNDEFDMPPPPGTEEFALKPEDQAKFKKGTGGGMTPDQVNEELKAIGIKDPEKAFYSKEKAGDPETKVPFPNPKNEAEVKANLMDLDGLDKDPDSEDEFRSEDDDIDDFDEDSGPYDVDQEQPHPQRRSLFSRIFGRNQEEPGDRPIQDPYKHEWGYDEKGKPRNYTFMERAARLADHFGIEIAAAQAVLRARRNERQDMIQRAQQQAANPDQGGGDDFDIIDESSGPAEMESPEQGVVQASKMKRGTKEIALRMAKNLPDEVRSKWEEKGSFFKVSPDGKTIEPYMKNVDVPAFLDQDEFGKRHMSNREDVLKRTNPKAWQEWKMSGRKWKYDANGAMEPDLPNDVREDEERRNSRTYLMQNDPHKFQQWLMSGAQYKTDARGRQVPNLDMIQPEETPVDPTAEEPQQQPEDNRQLLTWNEMSPQQRQLAEEQMGPEDFQNPRIQRQIQRGRFKFSNTPQMRMLADEMPGPTAGMSEVPKTPNQWTMAPNYTPRYDESKHGGWDVDKLNAANPLRKKAPQPPPPPPPPSSDDEGPDEGFEEINRIPDEDSFSAGINPLYDGDSSDNSNKQFGDDSDPSPAQAPFERPGPNDVYKERVQGNNLYADSTSTDSTSNDDWKDSSDTDWDDRPDIIPPAQEAAPPPAEAAPEPQNQTLFKNIKADSDPGPNPVPPEPIQRPRRRGEGKDSLYWDELNADQKAFLKQKYSNPDKFSPHYLRNLIGGLHGIKPTPDLLELADELPPEPKPAPAPPKPIPQQAAAQAAPGFSLTLGMPPGEQQEIDPEGVYDLPERPPVRPKYFLPPQPTSKVDSDPTTTPDYKGAKVPKKVKDMLKRSRAQVQRAGLDEKGNPMAITMYDAVNKGMKVKPKTGIYNKWDIDDDYAHPDEDTYNPASFTGFDKKKRKLYHEGGAEISYRYPPGVSPEAAERDGIEPQIVSTPISRNYNNIDEKIRMLSMKGRFKGATSTTAARRRWAENGKMKTGSAYRALFPKTTGLMTYERKRELLDKRRPINQRPAIHRLPNGTYLRGFANANNK